VAIVDAHHHIWRLTDLPWLGGPPVPRIFGDYRALRRDYLIGECLSGLSEPERTMVWHDTAARVYHLGRSGREAPSTRP